MGMDLLRGDDRIYVTHYSWARVYAFAIEGGWNPLGTLPPDYFTEEEKANWSGTYKSNDYQIITSEDALLMAFALEKMLQTLGEEVETAGIGIPLNDDYDLPSVFFIEKARRTVLKQLINFLKGGACVIG